MITFTTAIHQFSKQGEKTGWTYIGVPDDIAQQLKPGNKRSFRVKGKLDKYSISGVALIPMGGGSFILPMNAAMRKGTGKKKGSMLLVQLALDNNALVIPPEFLECLADEPRAQAFFNRLSQSQRNYFTKWLGGVKGETAIAKRIAQSVTALAREQDFGTMLRSHKAEREKSLYK